MVSYFALSTRGAEPIVVSLAICLCMRSVNDEEFFGELSFAPERRAVQKCKVFHLISLFLSGYNNVVVAWEIMGRQ